MKEPAPLPFLERQSYRRRRLLEALRLLPYLGILLIFMPILWTTGEAGDQARTAGGGLYIFLVWAVLIVAAAAFSRRIQKDDRTTSSKDMGRGRDFMPGTEDR